LCFFSIVLLDPLLPPTLFLPHREGTRRGRGGGSSGGGGGGAERIWILVVFILKFKKKKFL
jgi:hypothetical protein